MSLVEILIGIGIVTLVVAFVGVSVVQFIETRNTIMSDTKKVFLAEEGYEMVRFLRDSDWTNLSNLSLNTNYYLEVATSTIDATTTPQVIDAEFLRLFRLVSVYRDGSDNVVASTTPGATIDNDARQIEISVGNSTGTTTIRSILMNFGAI